MAAGRPREPRGGSNAGDSSDRLGDRNSDPATVSQDEFFLCAWFGIVFRSCLVSDEQEHKLIAKAFGLGIEGTF